MVQVVVLCANGEHKSSKIADVSAAGIAKANRKIKQPAVLGTYTWNEQTLTLWGWVEGRAGTENKHELPPPHDKGLFFSDVIVSSSAGDFTVVAWKEFYEVAFKGSEDLGDEDTDSEGGDIEATAEINGDADAEEEDFDDDEDEDEEANGGGEGEDEGEGDGEGDDGSAAGSEDAEEEEEDADEDCYDSDEGGGGGKRRAPRRRAMAAPEYRRMDMGLRSKITLPAQIGRRAPRWQTGPQLEPEA